MEPMKFILKVRSKELADPNPFRRWKVAFRYGKWRRIGVFTTKEEAQSRMGEIRRGMDDFAIFHKGKRVE